MINPLAIQPMPLMKNGVQVIYKDKPAYRVFVEVDKLNPFNLNESIVVRYEDFITFSDGTEEIIQSCTYIDNIQHLIGWFNTQLPQGVTVGMGILGSINAKLVALMNE